MYAYIAPTTTREFTVYGSCRYTCMRILPPPPHVSSPVYGAPCTVAVRDSRVCAQLPTTLPKKVTKKPSVNHIGSSNEPPKTLNSNLQTGRKGPVYRGKGTLPKKKEGSSFNVTKLPPPLNLNNLRGPYQFPTLLNT